MILIISAACISVVLSTLALIFAILSLCKVIGQEKSTHRLIYGNNWQEAKPTPPIEVADDDQTEMPLGHLKKKGPLSIKEQMREFMYPKENDDG